MIRGHCFTNMDRYKHERWPEEFAALPRVGDWVGAKSRTSLRVVAITHTMIAVRDYDNVDGYKPLTKNVAGIEVELNK